MLYAVAARFRPDAEPQREALHEAFNGHIAQRLLPLRLIGSLRSPEGARTGVLMLMEAEDIGQVRRFLAASPYAKAGLYARVEIDTIDVEVGSLA